MAGQAVFQSQPGLDDHSGMYSTSELNDPEYSTDDFRMFSFKVARCSKRYVHDWRSCPFAHPTENARRRDPRTTRYLPVPCPDYKRGICMRGDTCPYSHGVYECWLHPAKYRTQLCKEGPACRRPVCFFAHTVGDLRQPTHLWNGPEGFNEHSSAAAILAAQQSLATESSAGAGSGVGVGKSNIDIINNNNNGGVEGIVVDSAGETAAAAPITASTVTPPPSITIAEVAADAASKMQTAAEEAFNNMQQDGSGVTGGGSVHACQQGPGGMDSPTHTGGDLTPTAADAMTIHSPHGSHGVANGGSTVTSPFAQDAAAAMAREDSDTHADGNATTTTTTGESSSMQCRAASAAAQAGAPSWSQSMATVATSAAALSGIPVNEQPMLANNGPRMSNAVARKLGLAPVKPPTVAVAEARARVAVAAPHSTSLDGMGLPYVKTTPTTGASPMAPTVHTPPPATMSLEDLRLQQALAGLGGGAMPFPATAQYGAPYSSSYPGGSSDPLSIHPALLNLVAANMVGGGGTGSGAPPSATMFASFDQQQQQQQQQQRLNGSASGLHDASVASLLGQMSQWGMSDGSEDSIRTGTDGSVHSSAAATTMNNNNHAAGMISYPHRGSFDGMVMMGPAHGIATIHHAHAVHHHHQQSGGQSNAHAYLSSLDAGMDANNNRAGGGEC